ncbi:hypothetical protein [Prescottella equi]|uniref:hypothetical protein n=1 Tax=Rhodococcus hoagii TaxID=43767 RepID=UPI001130E021|nr:hypothetical protein [Prescottella equi]
MSQGARIAECVAAPVANRRAARRRVNPAELSNLPARKGRAGALAFFDEIGVHGVTETRIRNATERGQLRRYKLAGHNWYSEVDLWEWLQSMATGGQIAGDAA